ncbi:MAG: C_GCAxxG_C_C family protein [Oscillospiraceae bacterium]|nr:C_GCAxxG_C_C family protein [Oscillospiraceae bacterium]
MDRIEKAALLKRSNNCCQAVLLSYADVLELSEEQLTRLGKTFGAGMGGMQATCGALVGAGMVLGLLGGNMMQAKALHQEFETLCGASVCKDLKGVTTGKVLCPCDECVRNAVRALEGILHG